MQRGTDQLAHFLTKSGPKDNAGSAKNDSNRDGQQDERSGAACDQAYFCLDSSGDSSIGRLSENATYSAKPTLLGSIQI